MPFWDHPWPLKGRLTLALEAGGGGGGVTRSLAGVTVAAGTSVSEEERSPIEAVGVATTAVTDRAMEGEAAAEECSVGATLEAAKRSSDSSEDVEASDVGVGSLSSEALSWDGVP